MPMLAGVNTAVLFSTAGMLYYLLAFTVADSERHTIPVKVMNSNLNNKLIEHTSFMGLRPCSDISTALRNKAFAKSRWGCSNESNLA